MQSSLPTDKQMIAAARMSYHEGGSVEIDDDAYVSRAENNPEQGAYVAAWVWVSDQEALEVSDESLR